MTEASTVSYEIDGCIAIVTIDTPADAQRSRSRHG
jgi:hypothetical protein